MKAAKLILAIGLADFAVWLFVRHSLFGGLCAATAALIVLFWAARL